MKLMEALKYLRIEKQIPRKRIAEMVNCTEQSLFLIEYGKFGSRKFEKRIMEVAIENGYAKKEG